MNDNEKQNESITELADNAESTEMASTNKVNKPLPNKKPLSRRAKHGLLSCLICLCIIAAVILVNGIAMTLTDKFSGLTMDITSTQSFALSEQSKEIARNVSKKVMITFLTDRDAYLAIDPYCKQTAYIAEEMQKTSADLIEVTYVDLVRNPTFANDYAEENLSTTDIIVSCGDNQRILKVSDLFHFENYADSYRYIASSEAEQALDNAIMAVTNEEVTKTVLIADYCSQDTSYFIKTLKANGYQVKELSLMTDQIPSDTEMVVVYAPTKDYSEEAVEKLRRFLYNDGQYGKNMLFLSESQDAEIPHLDKLLNEYGMALGHGFAFEANSNYINSGSSNYFDGVLCQYFSGLYIQDSNAQLRPVITGYARPIEIMDAVIAAPLLSYSDNSGYCPFDADENWDMNAAITGNTFVLAQGQGGLADNPSTLIVSGTYRLFTQAYYGSAYNNQSYLSAMLAGVNHRSTERVTVAENVINTFDINISQQTAMNLGFVVYALIPIVILGIGIAVFLMRRNR